jgi:hypothetical protein
MSVESVGLELPDIFTVSGSPVTDTGTLTGELAEQPANTVFAGPASGADAIPAFRALDPADLPIATATTLGAVSIGDGLSVTGGGVLSADAPVLATTTVPGIISVGSGLSVTGGGVLSANAPALATTSTPGIISAGSGLSVNGSGVLSANAPALATASTPGIISAGSGLSVNGSGVLSANAPALATTSTPGVVSVGSGLSVNGSGVISKSNSFSVGVPALSSFTKVNQGSCTVSEISGQSITVNGAGSAAGTFNNFIMYKAAPSTPYRLAAYLSVGTCNTTYLGGGLAFYDPATTKYVEVFFCWNVNNVCNVQVSTWSSPTTFNTTPITWGWGMNAAGFWLGLRDDGTKVYYEYSADGANFVTIFSETKSTGYLSSYGNVAWVTNLSNATSSRTIANTLFIWDTNGLSRTPTLIG